MEKKNMKKIRTRMFMPELKRWLLNPFFFLAVFLSTAFNIADALSDPFVGDTLRSGDGYQTSALYVLVYSRGSGLLKYVGMCLCALTSSGLFAEDYRDNAVYPRVLRMGKVKYAFACTARTGVSAFFCGFLSEMASMAALVFLFGTTLFPDGAGDWTGSNSELIEDGRFFSYSFIFCGICGLRFAFYALSALIFSVFVPNKSAAAAIPLILFYFFSVFAWKVDLVSLLS